MDIIFRASLFHVLDLWFNNITAPVQKHNSTLIISKSFTLKNNENATITKPTEILPLNVEYVTSLSAINYYNIVLIFMCILITSSPTKRWFVHLTMATIVSLSILVFNFFRQSNEIVSELNFYIAMFLRFAFFFTICFFQSMRIKTEHRTKAVKFMTILFLFLAIIYPKNADNELAKYLISAFLIAQIMSEDLLENIHDIKQILTQVTKFLPAFCLIHTILVHFEEIKDRNESDWNRIFNNEGFIVFRVFLMIAVLAAVTVCIYKAVACLLSLNRNLKFVDVFFNTSLTSPVFFFAFAIDHEIWKFRFDSQWSTLLMYLSMHLVAILSALRFLSNKALMLKIRQVDSGRTKKQHRVAFGLHLFTFISTIFLLGLSFYLYATIGVHLLVQLMIIIGFVIYVIVKVIFDVLRFFLTNVEPYNQSYRAVHRVYYMKKLDLELTWLFLSYLGTVMFGHCILKDFRASILIGAAYYLKKMAVNVKDYLRTYQDLKHAYNYINSVLKINPEKMKLLIANDVCLICHGDLTSGCVTACKHYFHKCCLLMWLYDNNKCPYCLFVLFKGNDINTIEVPVNA